MMDKLVAALDAELEKQLEGMHYWAPRRGKFELRSLDGEMDVRELIRAILTALQQPSTAMLDRGPGEPYMDRDVWARMIDEAMK